MSDIHRAPGLVKIGDRDDWRIDFARYGGPFIVECGRTTANPDVGDTIAKVMVSYGADGRDTDFAKTQKRAYVMAAGPSLLTAAKAGADALMNADPGNPKDRTGWASDESREAWVGLREAIAKATPGGAS